MHLSPVDEFLMVVHHAPPTYPLSTVVVNDSQADWISANRYVAVWTWPVGLPHAERLGFA